MLDRIHEQRAAARARERSDVLFRELWMSAFGAAEDLAGEQGLGKRGAGNPDEGLRGAAAPRVDRAGEMILAAAGSADDQDRAIGTRERHRLIDDLLGRAASAHDPVAATATHRSLDRDSGSRSSTPRAAPQLRSSHPFFGRRLPEADESHSGRRTRFPNQTKPIPESDETYWETGPLVNEIAGPNRPMIGAVDARPAPMVLGRQGGVWDKAKTQARSPGGGSSCCRTA